MLAAEERPVRVVVQGRHLRTPGDVDRMQAPQHQRDGAAQLRRPLFGWAERRACPVVCADEPRHFAAMVQERQGALALAATMRMAAFGIGQKRQISQAVVPPVPELAGGRRLWIARSSKANAKVPYRKSR